MTYLELRHVYEIRREQHIAKRSHGYQHSLRCFEQVAKEIGGGGAFHPHRTANESQRHTGVLLLNLSNTLLRYSLSQIAAPPVGDNTTVMSL